MSYGQNSPYGLRYLNSLIGGASHVQTNNYLIRASSDGLTTYSTNIFTGDLVMWNPTLVGGNGGGSIAIWTTGANLPIGVFQGCYYQSLTNPYGFPTFSNYWPASTQVKANTPIIAKVIDDPFAVYSAQVSTSTNTTEDARLTRAYFGQNANFAVGGAAFVTNATNAQNNPAAGSATTGSAYYLDASTHAATSTLPLKILDYTTAIQEYERTTILAGPGNVPTAGAQYFLDVKVILNTQVYKSVGTAGTVAA